MKQHRSTTWFVWGSLVLTMSMIWPVSCAQGRLGDRLFGRSDTEEPAAEEGGTDDQPASGSTKVDLTFGALDRFYIIHVPYSYDKAKPTPLVINMHGGGGNPAQQQRDSGMDKVADENGFVVVYPAGSGKMKERFLTWNIGMSDTYATINNIDDIGFLRAVIKDVSGNYTIDKKRVYATGFSQGAMMCYKVACEMSDVFAAVAPVSGVMQVPRSDCKPARAMPIIHFHGLEDPNVAYKGGVGPKAHDKVPRPGVQESIDFWLAQDGIDIKPVKQGRTGQAEFKEYGPGKNGAQIILWTLDDGGHAWPGGNSSLPEWKVGKVNKDVRASDLIWSFFKKYSMP
ncbi:MAG: PHB depolymerase family esterase [bacterium]